MLTLLHKSPEPTCESCSAHSNLVWMKMLAMTVVRKVMGIFYDLLSCLWCLFMGY